MKKSIVALLIAVVVCFAATAIAQQNPNLETGFKPYGSYEQYAIDTVNVQNHDLMIRIPVYKYPQRGALSRNLWLTYSAKQWRVDTHCNLINPDLCTSKWLPQTVGTAPLGMSVVPDGWATPKHISLIGQGNTGPSSAKMVQSDWDGGSHDFLPSTPDPLRSGYTANRTVDGSRSMLSAQCYWCSNNSYGVEILRDASGIQLQSASNGVEDTNGNLITTQFSGGVGAATDSIGRTIDPGSTTIPAYGGTTQLQFTTVSVPVSTNFQATNQNGDPVAEYVGSVSAISSFAIYDGNSWATSPTWAFDYLPNNADGSNYADVKHVTLPSGGTITYQWEVTGLCLAGGTADGGDTQRSRSIVSRTLDANDGSGPQTWTYSWGPGIAFQTSIVTDPMGNDTVHTFGQIGTSSCVYNRETQTDSYTGSSSTGTLLKTVQTQYRYTPISSSYDQVVSVFPSVVTTIYPNGKRSKVEYDYVEPDGTTGTIPVFNWNGQQYNVPLGSVHEKREYDFQSGGTYQLLRRTHYTYMPASNSNFYNRNLMDRVATAITYDGVGNRVAETDYTYDEYGLQASGVSTTYRDANIGTYRGNPTTVSKWVTGTTFLASHTQYYDTGMPYTTTDPGGHINTYSYDLAYQGAYLTNTQMPDTNSPNLAHHAVSAGSNQSVGYDFNSGLLKYYQGDNLQGTTSQFSYSYDVLGRMTTANSPDGGNVTFTYPNFTSVTLTQAIDATKSMTTQANFDGLGRIIRKAVLNPGGSSLFGADTCYNGDGLVSFKSLPFQLTSMNDPSDCPTPTNPLPTNPGDAFLYDGLQRLTSVTHTADTTSATAQYTGAAVKTLDEGNGHIHVGKVTQVDGLGRLRSVCEISATNGDWNPALLGNGATPAACGLDIGATGYLTSYGYDALDNLTSVSQGGFVPRIFHYDGLSRLTDATNPESGLVSYTYAPDGMVQTRTRPAPNQTSATQTVVTTYTYDALHRLRKTSYNDTASAHPTPITLLNYDETTVAGRSTVHPNGLLTSQVTQVGSPATTNTGEYFWNFDVMGRPNGRSQCVPSPSNPSVCGTKYAFTYGYNFMGQETSAQLPGVASSVVLTTNYDTAARITGVTSSLSDAATLFTTDATSFGPLGLLHGTYGAKYNETISYSPRGRVAGVSDKTLTGSTLYSYTIGNFANDGNILGAQDNVNGNWAYTYDSFNRLSTATATNLGKGCAWIYDRFGNRFHQDPYGTGSCSPEQFSFNANNQIAGSGLYDAAGNMVYDPNPTFAISYVYDAENRLIFATPTGGNTYGYTYDAKGGRVTKAVTVNNVTSITTEFLQDSSGNQQIELDGSGVLQHTNLFAGGKLIATYRKPENQTYFHFEDWLGTRRVEMSASGTNVQNCSNLPFGDAQNCTGSGPDATENHFAGKERDIEDGLDYSGARYYSSAMGRFLSSDPSQLYYSNPTNPQSLNLYSYAYNNPVMNVDPKGTDACAYDNGDGTATIYSAVDGGAVECKGDGFYINTTQIVTAVGFDSNGDLSVYGADGGLYNSDGSSFSISQTVNVGSDGSVSFIGPNTINSPRRQYSVSRPAAITGSGYTQADICAASAVLHNGLNTSLDLLGSVPVLGNWTKGTQAAVNGVQLAGGLVAAGMATSKDSAPLDAATAGAGLGLTGAASREEGEMLTKASVKFFGSSVEVLPFIGNGISALSLVNDIWGKDGMLNYYKDCMEGKN